MNMKTFLVSIQEKYGNKVFGYKEIIAIDSYYAKSIALKEINTEQKYTNKWKCLHQINWCLDAVEL